MLIPAALACRADEAIRIRHRRHDTLAPWRHRVRVQVHTSADLVRELVDPSVATVIDDGDECELDFGTDDLDWAAPVARLSQPRHRRDRADLAHRPAARTGPLAARPLRLVVVVPALPPYRLGRIAYR
jgi:hypothetical protein